MFWYDDTFYIFPDEPNRVAFIADAVVDIANLPTTKTPGVPQGVDNVSYEPVTAGSVVFIIATSEVYMLNSSDSWVLQPKHGGSQPTPSATTLAELTDVQLGTLVDGNLFAYDATASKWINSGNINDLQTKTLEEPIVIEGHEYDSVEDALQEISNMFVWDEG